MSFIIKIFLTTIIIGLGTYIIEWLKNDWLSNWNKKWIVVTVAVIGAILVILVELSSNSIDMLIQEPKIVIETTRDGGEINFSINIDGSIERISINYPVIGNVTNFQDLNSITDARTTIAKVVGGNTQNDIQNNLQISITDIKDGAKLQYKLFYGPSLGNIEVGGTDRYEIVYSWNYGSEKIQNTEWRMTEDDSATTKPSIQVVGAQVFDRVLTQEEIKNMYEAGLQKEIFD